MVVINEKLITTARLELHLIDVPDLIAMHYTPEIASKRRYADFTNPHGVLINNPGPLPWRVPQVEKDPSVNRWLLRFVVLQESREVIGSVSFHAPPDDQGMVEIGIGIEEAFRGNGYATEALRGMWTWACSEPSVSILRYTVAPTNLASVAIVQSFGFQRIGHQIDEIDGIEDIYEISAAEFSHRYV